MCYYESDVSYFTTNPSNDIVDTTLQSCCDYCHNYTKCLSWTFVPASILNPTSRCLIYDSFRPNPANAIGLISGFSDKATAFAFHSLFDQFQMKFYDLTPEADYSFINSRPFYTLDQQAYLKEAITYIESNVNVFSYFTS